jgi:hypothetical protein
VELSKSWVSLRLWDYRTFTCSAKVFFSASPSLLNANLQPLCYIAPHIFLDIITSSNLFYVRTISLELSDGHALDPLLARTDRHITQTRALAAAMAAAVPYVMKLKRRQTFGKFIAINTSGSITWNRIV